MIRYITLLLFIGLAYLSCEEEPEDCAGVASGTAFTNNCGECVGGITGLDEAYCGTVTDIDGNVYNTVIIGDQVWMAENLKVTHYRNGDEIPTGYSNNDWTSLSIGAYAVYSDNSANEVTYGNLYNWYAVDDSRNIALEGWHVPTDNDFQDLTLYLDKDTAGSKLAGRADLWHDGDLENNSEFGTSGFTALPGGYRSSSSGTYNGMGDRGYFWSSTEYGSNIAWYRLLYYYDSEVDRNREGSKNGGFSVRCVRD
jgi:uncharacterized protein (TIGR02145 family)